MRHILAEMRENGGAVSERTRAALAVEAYTLTAGYDTAISTWLRSTLLDEARCPASWPSAAKNSRTCATGKIRTRPAASTEPPACRPMAWRPPPCCRARNSPSTTILDLEAVLERRA